MVVTILLSSASAVAAEKRGPAEAQPWTLVYLQTFVVPTLREGSQRRHQSAMTVILEVATEQAGAVCRLYPRIKDALTMELHRNPIRFDRDRNFDIESTERNLLAPVNNVLDDSAVKRVLLIPGIRKIEDVVNERMLQSNLQSCSSINS
ncbi:MAG: hypothetical protein MI741_10610 [Rhodospirillales bacterium]|nr:hypothetical protein [Rhodospirillales bacterium]